MLFNSATFLLFLPIAFFVYWLVNCRGVKFQNLLLLILSYVFYGWWDWRFLSLIAFSTVVDYVSAQSISKIEKNSTKKLWLWVSILVNIGLLGVFKYYNFFITSWVDLLSAFGYHASSSSLNIILPVGISFYTFQTMSYTIDVYQRKINPTNNIIAFAAYVSFFPQLVAGPIERASSLLPQILKKRKFDYDQGVQGMRLILWGMFKKVVIADTLAIYVDQVFTQWGSYTGTTLLVSCIYFGFQIYCDFSGYSDIAVGTAKLFGIELRSNFKFPYFSKNIIEFWRKWHISLSTWFRDYIYIRLGGSKHQFGKTIRNIFIVFTLSGLWHGANWTFVVWGVVHAIIYTITHVVLVRKKMFNSNSLPVKISGIIITFLITNIAWIFFRSDTIQQAYLMLKKICLFAFTPLQLGEGLIYVAIILTLDALANGQERDPITLKNSILRRVYYLILLIAICAHWERSIDNFIYFQF